MIEDKEKKMQYWEWMLLSEDPFLTYEREQTKLSPEEYYGENPDWWDNFLEEDNNAGR